MPPLNKIKGQKTVLSIVDKIETEVLARLQSNFAAAGYTYFPKEVIMAAFKEEQKLLIFAKDQEGIKFIKQYPFTAYSGQLGPKLKEGDRQIPEGIYQVEYLNPNSSYYLSIKIDYPNAFDKAKTTFSNIAEMGGDIFIHGKSATIGCIPIGDLAIEEVFVLTQKSVHQKIIISPLDFRKTDTYPKIAGIEWETELYELIKKELIALPL